MVLIFSFVRLSSDISNAILGRERLERHTLFGTTIFLTLVAGSLQASIVSSTNCSAGDGKLGVSNSGPNSCSATYNDPTLGQGKPAASASTSATYTGPVTGSPSSNVDLKLSDNGSAYAFATYASTYASGAANESATFTFETLGPVRAGEIVFTATADVAFGGDPPYPNNVSFSIGDINSSCTAAGANLYPADCTGTIGGSDGLPVTPQTQSFTLGQTFTLQENVAINATGSWTSGGDGTGLIDFTFHLLDANGNPVQVYDITTPEPASFWLAGLAIPLLISIRIRRWQS